MLRALTAAARSLGLPGRHVLVAVSGGIDSSVLLHALHTGAARLRLTLHAGHVNHGLRGAEADADEAFVHELGAKLDVPVLSVRADPRALREGHNSRTRPTLQEAARRARYDALAGLAQRAGADVVATAHTADDQAETVLLRLLRGAGPDGLGGIPERSPDGHVVRPMLGVSRAEVRGYALARGLDWREDSSNRKPEFARVRLRTEWLPGLAAAFNPRLLRAIVDLAEAQRRDAEWIEVEVAREAAERFTREGQGLRIRRDGWQDLPEALVRRLARRALRECGAGRDVSRAHLERVVGFWRKARTGRHIELPGGLTLVCERDGFRLGHAGSPARVRPPTACYAGATPREMGSPHDHGRVAGPPGTVEGPGGSREGR